MIALVVASEAAGVWTLQAGVMADNPASLALHEKHGFRRVGFRERIGRDSTGHWRDVVLLERRSAVAGIRVGGGPWVGCQASRERRPDNCRHTALQPQKLPAEHW